MNSFVFKETALAFVLSKWVVCRQPFASTVLYLLHSCRKWSAPRVSMGHVRFLVARPAQSFIESSLHSNNQGFESYVSVMLRGSISRQSSGWSTMGATKRGM